MGDGQVQTTGWRYDLASSPIAESRCSLAVALSPWIGVELLAVVPSELAFHLTLGQVAVGSPDSGQSKPLLSCGPYWG